MNPPELFETHAHLHFPEFADDLDAVLARAAGVRRMVTIGTDAPTVIYPVSQILRAARRVSPRQRERPGRVLRPAQRCWFVTGCGGDGYRQAGGATARTKSAGAPVH